MPRSSLNPQETEIESHEESKETRRREREGMSICWCVKLGP